MGVDGSEWAVIVQEEDQRVIVDGSWKPSSQRPAEGSPGQAAGELRGKAVSNPYGVIVTHS